MSEVINEAVAEAAAKDELEKTIQSVSELSGMSVDELRKFHETKTKYFPSSAASFWSSEEPRPEVLAAREALDALSTDQRIDILGEVGKTHTALMDTAGDIRKGITGFKHTGWGIASDLGKMSPEEQIAAREKLNAFEALPREEQKEALAPVNKITDFLQSQ